MTGGFGGAVRYWDDVDVGKTYETPGRTATEAELMLFSGLTGDHRPLHTDEVVAQGSIYGGRFAHGLLDLAYLQGLETGASTGIAAMGSLGWTVEFRAPIRGGDTISGRRRVGRKLPTSKPDRGILFVETTLVDQTRRVQQSGEHRELVQRRPVEHQQSKEGG